MHRRSLAGTDWFGSGPSPPRRRKLHVGRAAAARARVQASGKVVPNQLPELTALGRVVASDGSCDLAGGEGAGIHDASFHANSRCANAPRNQPVCALFPLHGCDGRRLRLRCPALRRAARAPTSVMSEAETIECVRPMGLGCRGRSVRHMAPTMSLIVLGLGSRRLNGVDQFLVAFVWRPRSAGDLAARRARQSLTGEPDASRCPCGRESRPPVFTAAQIDIPIAFVHPARCADAHWSPPRRAKLDALRFGTLLPQDRTVAGSPAAHPPLMCDSKGAMALSYVTLGRSELSVTHSLRERKQGHLVRPSSQEARSAPVLARAKDGPGVWSG